MKRLFHSAKFLTLVIDVVISLTSYFVGKYVAPDAAKDILFFIGTIQPVFLALIASIAYEDGQEKQGLASSQAYEARWQEVKPDAEAERK